MGDKKAPNMCPLPALLGSHSQDAALIAGILVPLLLLLLAIACCACCCWAARLDPKDR